MLIDQLVDLGIAVAIIVGLGTADIVRVESRVRVVDKAGREVEADNEILACDLGEPVCRVDRLELAVDMDVFQLVDQDDRRIPVARRITRRHLYLEPVIGSVAELLHDRAGLGAVLRHVGAIARQRLQDIRRHAP